MTETGELAREFDAFQNECVDLAILINTFDALFANQQQDQGYAECAPTFFSDLNRWLIELYYLRVFRLLDKAEASGRSNLTANYLVQRLKDESKSTEEIETLLDRLNCYKATIQPARHRLVAHTDLKTIASDTSLGAHDDSCAHPFRRDLQDFCDAVGHVVGAGPSDFINIAPGDVGGLIRILQKKRNPKAGRSD